MVCNGVMDSKKKYTIFADESVVERLMAVSPRYGDKSLLVCAGAALFLTMDEATQREILSRYDMARSKSRFGGTVLDEFKKLLGRDEKAQVEGLQRRAVQELENIPSAETSPAPALRRTRRRSA